MSTKISDQHQADYKRSIYRAGMAATAFMLLMIPVQVVFYLVWPHPTTIVEWYGLFQENWFVGLVSFDFLYLLSMFASIFLYLALFFALNDSNKSLSLFAVAIGLIGGVDRPCRLFSIKYLPGNAYEQQAVCTGGVRTG